jgi:hypothetical protein
MKLLMIFSTNLADSSRKIAKFRVLMLQEEHVASICRSRRALSSECLIAAIGVRQSMGTEGDVHVTNKVNEVMNKNSSNIVKDFFLTY